MAEGRFEEALVILKQGAKANRRTLPPDNELREMMEKFKLQVRSGNLVFFWKHLFCLNSHNANAYKVLTTALQCIKT
jgi:hypothetical protein